MSLRLNEVRVLHRRFFRIPDRSLIILMLRLSVSLIIMPYISGSISSIAIAEETKSDP